MSGRLFTTVAVSICLVLVAFAFWQRSLRTQRIREFWGANQASLIQHAPMVRLSVNGEAWRDVSRAPGLVHLRATLVDDRYFQWNETATSQGKEPASGYRLEFSRDQTSIALSIDASSGIVTNLERNQHARLIPASQQAVAAYLKEIQ